MAARTTVTMLAIQHVDDQIQAYEKRSRQIDAEHADLKIRHPAAAYCDGKAAGLQLAMVILNLSCK